MNRNTRTHVRCIAKFVYENTPVMNKVLLETLVLLKKDFLSIFSEIYFEKIKEKLIIGQEYTLQSVLNKELEELGSGIRVLICQDCGKLIYTSKQDINTFLVNISNIDNLSNYSYDTFFIGHDGRISCKSCSNYTYFKCPITGNYYHKKDLVQKTLNVVYAETTAKCNDLTIHKHKFNVYKNAKIKRGAIFVKDFNGNFIETNRKNVKLLINPKLDYDYVERKVRFIYDILYFADLKALENSLYFSSVKNVAKSISCGYFVEKNFIIDEIILSYNETKELIDSEKIKRCRVCYDCFIAEKNQKRCDQCVNEEKYRKLKIQSYSTKFNSIIEPNKQFQHCSNDNSIKNLYYGIEIEANVWSDDYLNSTVKDVIERTDGFLFAKHDGSLDDDVGVEFVSAPASFEKTREFLNKLFDNKNTACDLEYKDKKGENGIHIHISRSALTNSDIARIVYFFNTHTGFCQKIGNRNYNSYCRYRNVAVVDDNNDIDEKRTHANCMWSDDRYQCVNVRNLDTIEIRIFDSIINRNVIFSYIEFVDAIVRMSKKIGVREKYGFKYMNPKNLKMLIKNNNKYKFLNKAIKEKGL